MTELGRWVRWLFRRGTRGSLLLNMVPGDRIVSMTVYREYLAILSERGELYLLDRDRLVEFQQAEIQNIGRSLPDA
jgi:hypothetical protein